MCFYLDFFYIKEYNEIEILWRYNNMKDTYISDDIIYIGADDKTIDLFESQYVVPNGISYNSYLIKDEKTVIMDTIDRRKTDEWLDNLEKALERKKT